MLSTAVSTRVCSCKSHTKILISLPSISLYLFPPSPFLPSTPLFFSLLLFLISSFISLGFFVSPLSLSPSLPFSPLIPSTSCCPLSKGTCLHSPPNIPNACTHVHTIFYTVFLMHLSIFRYINMYHCVAIACGIQCSNILKPRSSKLYTI